MSDKITGKKKNIMLVIAIVLFGLLLVGGTYAYRLISASITNGSYNVLSACFDIDYDEGDEIRGTLFQSSGPKGGLSGEVTMKVMDDCSLTGLGTITLHVKEMTDSILLSEGALKYAVYDNIEEKPLSYGVITYVGDIDIYSDFKLTRKPVTYYIYIWLDGNIADNEYVNASFDGYIGASAENVIITGPEAPVLDSGMIPVKLSSNGTATTVSVDDVNWYNYDNKEWANVVLVDDDSRDTYKNSTGVTVEQNDILAYYVWIPRYKYKIWNTGMGTAGSEQTIDVVFEAASDEMSLGTQVGEYRTHPAFWWDDNNDGNVDAGETVAGIWVGKFETSANTDSTCYTSNSTANCVASNVSPRIVPNVNSLRYQSVSTQFMTSQKFSTSGNIYGLSNVSTDAHMMKNSEWGAVAYLSHSVYGINDEIRLNNNSNYITGCGASSEERLSVSSCEISYNSETTPQSTTGNITGVFDMAGGTWEHVMGYYSLANSSYTTDPDTYFGRTASTNAAGFSSLLDYKYWNNYTTINTLTACSGGVCFGHALSETANWYKDYAKFIDSGSPWFIRGGYSSVGASAGVFTSYNALGDASYITSWRSVLVMGNYDS